MLKFGLIGKKLSYSLSPKIHQLIMNRLNINGEYQIYEIEEENFKKGLDWISQNDIRGVNVTIPYKISVINYIDKLSPEAEKIGSVNTILFRKECIEGFNTDYYGFMSTLEEFNIELKNKSVVILGTGGAAAAIYQCVRDMNASTVKFVSRGPNIKKNFLTKKEVDVISYDELKHLNGDVIINCTPCGMQSQIKCSPVDKAVISKFEIAMDLIYSPRETLFLECAKSLGLKTCNGLYMLVSQAIASQEIWNGIRADRDCRKYIYKEMLKY